MSAVRGSALSLLRNVARAAGAHRERAIGDAQRCLATQAASKSDGSLRTNVSDILADKGMDASWQWCTTDDSVLDAVKLMAENNVGALLVGLPGAKRDAAGIFTERDYLKKMAVAGRSSSSTKVGEVMTEASKLITVNPETSVFTAMEIMTAKKIRNIPVVEDKKIKGLVSIVDVVKAVVEEQKEEMKRMNEYIQGSY